MSEASTNERDEQLEALLPWYVNGTLSEAEHSAVAAWLASSPAAREQEAFLRALANQCQPEETSVSELGWKRLQRELRAEQPRRSTASSYWKPAFAAAATVVMALQIGILMREPDSASDMRLLSQQSTVQSQSQWVIQLELREDADWQAVSATLIASGGQLVEGPSALGLVRLAVPQQGSPFASADELILWLQQQTVVAHVALETP